MPKAYSAVNQQQPSRSNQDTCVEPMERYVMPKLEPFIPRRTTVTAPQYGLPRPKPRESLPSAARLGSPPAAIAAQPSVPQVQFKRRKTIAGAVEILPPTSTTSRAGC